tara:strand:- start:311 stop:526 length:216 start_codon:yes stop_codon:yes gene_type:complete
MFFIVLNFIKENKIQFKPGRNCLKRIGLPSNKMIIIEIKINNGENIINPKRANKISNSLFKNILKLSPFEQ